MGVSKIIIQYAQVCEQSGFANFDRMRKHTILYILLGLLVSFTAVGQTKSDKLTYSENLIRLKREARQHPPKALLVQIFTRKRLTEYYTKSGQTKKLEALKQDIEGVKNAMVADFTDNYTYSPVYFFYDTNAEAIRNKQFSGVLLDKDLQPVKNIVLTAADSNYFIAYFGATAGSGATASYGFKGNNTDNDVIYSSDNIKREAHRLRLLDAEFNELPQYVIRDAYDINRKYRKWAKYSYNSSLLKIYYWAFATQLDKNFRFFYDDESRH